MLGYAETLFLKAEAAILVWRPLSAEQYYNAGIAANFFLGGLFQRIGTYKDQWHQSLELQGRAFQFPRIVNFSIPRLTSQDLGSTMDELFPRPSFDSCAGAPDPLLRFFTDTNPGGYSSYTAHPTYMDIPGRALPNSSANRSKTLNPDGYNSAVSYWGPIGG